MTAEKDDDDDELAAGDVDCILCFATSALL
jgi:hypothetical protein